MKITALWRHPIKAHGREALEEVTLTKGASMPFDRTWAVAHSNSKAVAGEWAACSNFMRAASTPQLQAITATLNEDTQQVTLRHPERPDLTFSPDTEVHAFVEWVRPLCAPDRALPMDILRIGARGFTDSDIASVSLMNIASHAAIEAAAETSLDTARWRGNVWFDGAPAWSEFDLIGKTLQLGEATVRVDAPYQRCKSIMANTDTGHRDHDLLATLRSFGHQNFGVGFSVLEGGRIRLGDSLELI